jgi:hypothetical protein
MKQKYFGTPAAGVNADIARHRQTEAELLAHIEEAEKDNSPMGRAQLGAYRRLLAILQDSKAEVVSKIGRKQ